MHYQCDLIHTKVMPRRYPSEELHYSIVSVMYVFRVYTGRIFTEAYGLVMRDTIPQFIDIIKFAKHISIVKFMTLSGFWLIGKYTHQCSAR